MPYASAPDMQLYYEVHGPKPGTAPAIVFAHGMGGNHLSWWQQVPHFATRYACVTFDHRGFGQSVEGENGRGGTAFVDDLQLLLDHLGIERATLVAQSMGGWTCLGFALRHPSRVERLVMCDTHGGLAADDIAQAWMAARPALADLPPGVHPAAGARMFREQPELHFLYAQINDLNPVRSPSDLLALLAAAGSPKPEEVASLDVPVLFIAGEEDIVIPPRVCDLAAGYFRNARVEHVPQAGHSVYFERPQVFNEIVERFVRACIGREP